MYCMNMCILISKFLFFFNDTPPTAIYTLSLHDALPISLAPRPARRSRMALHLAGDRGGRCRARPPDRGCAREGEQDRKSTRLNSSHVSISYAVFCLKKKKINSRISIYYFKINQITYY